MWAKAMRRVERAMVRRLGFRVSVAWEGARFEHWAWTVEGALEWARAYPRGSAVVVTVPWLAVAVAMRVAA